MIKILILSIFALSAEAMSLAEALNDKMNYLAARQSIVAGNIANSSTPYYLAKDIEYTAKPSNSSISAGMVTTNAKHMTGGSFKSAGAGYKQVEDKTFIRNDGNSVRTDEQMLKLANIQQEHAMATRLFAKHMALQKIVVQLR